MKVLKACCLRNGEKNNNKHIVAIAIDEDDEVHSVTEWKALYSSICVINRYVIKYKVVCDSRCLYWSSSGDDICVSVSHKILQCSFGMSDFLRHHLLFPTLQTRVKPISVSIIT